MSSTYVRADDTADLFDDTESTNGKPSIHVHQKIPNSTCRLFFDAARHYACEGKRHIVWKFVFGILLFVLGMLLGFVIKRAVDKFSSPCYGYTTIEYDAKLVDQVELEPAYIRDIVIEVSRSVHLAGTPENQRVRDYITSELTKINLPWRKYSYKVALRPLSTTSQFELRDPATKKYTCLSCQLNVTEFPTSLVPPFIAYSATAQLKKADVLYVNYGRKEDFEELIKNNISCVPRATADGLALVVRRSAKVPISDVVQVITDYCSQAVSNGVSIDRTQVVAMFYADPGDWSNDWNEMSKYVAGSRFTGDMAQFGNGRGDNGDPDTPYLPSIDNVLRDSMSEDREVPKIALMPIGYSDAQMLLSGLRGPLIQSFKGGLPITYPTGPGYQMFGSQNRTDWFVYASVIVKQPEVLGKDILSEISNVVATFEGELEPDRYVIIGTHYDAMPIGAADSASGVGLLLAIGKGLRKLYDAGKWKPRRTIVLAFWDAEEYGAIGSTEFIEQFGTELAARTVAYINIDSPVLGTYTFYSRMHPLIAGVLFEVAKSVRIDLGYGPANGPTVYERWCQRAPFNTKQNEPDIIPPGSSTDVSAFWQLRGIPFLFPQYRARPPNGNSSVEAWPSRVDWPMQHTYGDTQNTLQRVMDMGFATHALLGRILTGTLLRLSDSALLPYDPLRFALWLKQRFMEKVDVHRQELLELGCSYPYVSEIERLLEEMVNSSRIYLKQRDSMDKSNLFALRRENDRMMMLVEAFETDYQYDYRHTYSLLFDYADGYHDSPMYFPGISRALIDKKQVGAHEAYANCRREMSALMLAVKTANRILQDDLLDDISPNSSATNSATR